MKIFKRIYYPVMAVLFVLMLVLGIVDSRVATSGGTLSSARVDAADSYAKHIAGTGNGTHNSYETLSQQSVREYIMTTLTDAGAEQVPPAGVSDELDENGNSTVEYFTDYDGNKKPSLYVQKATVRQDSQGGNNEFTALREVRNIILAIPGKESGAILLNARYDSSAIGGASDAVAVGALLESAVDALKSGNTHRNAVVYLFSDAGQEGDLGAYAFVKQFVGFDNVAGEIKAVADFKAGGTDGTLMVYSGSDNNLNLVGKYAGLNGGTFASGALSVFTERSDYKSSGVFGDYNTLNFTNRDGFNRYATANDTTVNKKLVEQNANAAAKFVKAFADTDAKSIDSKSCAVYFSYLDVMTVYYPASVAFVIAGIIIGLVIAIVILNIKNKAFSWGKALAGLAVQLVTLLATSLASLALYYLFALLLSGFGVIPFQGISSVKYASSGLLISASVLAVTLAIFFYIIFKRAFGVKAPDVVRGNVIIFSLVAVVLSFALPSVSYPFTCVALFALLALLFTVLFKNKFRDKCGMSMELLFLYAWAVIFSLPLFLPLFFAAQTLFPAVTIVIIMAVMVALTGFVTPYADYFKPVLDRGFKKLPKRTVRYERMVTEKVEDRAKKGKFTEVTVKKIETEKEPWVYRNRIGLSFVSIIAAVMIILFCSFSTVYSSAAVDVPTYYNSIYDDSLLLVYEKNEGAAADISVAVYDKVAYDHIRYAVNDLDWNDKMNAYTKEYTGDINKIIPTAPDFTKSGDLISFTVFDPAYSQVTVTLKGASAVTRVVFNDEDGSGEEYTFSGKDEITFRLPYGSGDFTMRIDGSCEVVYEQHVYNDSNLQSVDGGDWFKMHDYYNSNPEIGPALRSGVVIKITKSL